MKAPTNYDRFWHNCLKDEAARISHEVITQYLANPTVNRFIKVQVSDNVASNLSGDDSFRLLEMFDAPYCYLTNLPGTRKLIFTVNTANIGIGILRHVSKVRPIRLSKSHKI